MFYILDAGARVQTPVESLLANRDVQPVSAPARVRPVDESESTAEENRALIEDAYGESNNPAPRHRVKFAREIMTTPVITGSTDQTLQQIWKLFSERRIHHLPLLDGDGEVRGIVSDRDITRFAANVGHLLPTHPIRDLMTRRVVVAAPDTEVRELAEVLVRGRIGALPIVAENGALAGIVSRSDILRTLVHRAPLELWT